MKTTLDKAAVWLEGGIAKFVDCEIVADNWLGVCVANRFTSPTFEKCKIRDYGQEGGDA